MYSALNHKNLIGAICLDVAKAFNSINNHVLLHKFTHKGFNRLNLYADDCILYASGNDWNRMIQKIQPEVNDVYFWCTANRLK